MKVSIADTGEEAWTADSNLTVLETITDGKTYIVTDDNAVLRGAPPTLQSIGEIVAKDTKVIATQRYENSLYIKAAEGDQAILGWTSESNLTSQIKIDQKEFIDDYKTWLEARVAEVAQLQGDAKVNRVEGLLSQVEQVSVDLIYDRLPSLDDLSTTPEASTNNGQGYVPPELIGVVRQLIEVLETDVAGTEETELAEGVIEGSQYGVSTDWNSRLGVPQYRTQSDNLASPEATCNVTSFTMVAERLGFNRGDMLDAITEDLKESYLQTAEGQQAAQAANGAEIEVPESFWQEKLEAYLEHNNDETKNYRKPRGGNIIPSGEEADEKITEIAEDYVANAQTEDLMDFYLYLKDISRYSINSGSNPETILNDLSGGEVEHEVEKLWGWSDDNKTKLEKCLSNGGAATISIFHKGKKNGSYVDGSHIISVQSVTSDGLIVDDPYGAVDSTYDRTSNEDAFADSGSRTRDSDHKNQPNYTDEDDWQVSNAQDLTDAESLGDSHEMSEDTLDDATNYIVLYHRGLDTEDREIDEATESTPENAFETQSNEANGTEATEPDMFDDALEVIEDWIVEPINNWFIDPIADWFS